MTSQNKAWNRQRRLAGEGRACSFLYKVVKKTSLAILEKAKAGGSLSMRLAWPT